MRKAIRKLLPIIVVLGVALYSVWAIVRCLSCVADYGRDGFFANWNIYTAGKNIYGLHLGNIDHIFDGNIFYPYKDVLAYSDMNIITGFWVFPLATLVRNPMISSGMTIVVGQVTTLLVLYFWWYKLGKNRWAAIAGTLAFGLSQFRFQYQVHVQMWSMQYWLWGAYLISDWMRESEINSWKLYFGAALLGAQVWESILPVYFATLILLCQWLIFRNKIQIRKALKAGLTFGLIAVIPLVIYWKVSREFNFQRSIRDAAHFGLSVNDLWKVSSFTSTGLYLLLVVALWQIIKRKDWNRETVWLLTVLIVGFVLALGPTLKWDGGTIKIFEKLPIPLPYALAYYIVPGFSAMRTSSRWIWVAGFGASGLITLGMKQFQFSVYNWKKNMAVLGILMVAIVGGTSVYRVRKMPSPNDAPEVYKWLATQPGGAIVILPMEENEWEEERLPDSFIHNKRTVNGYSSFYPPNLATLGNKLTVEYPSLETTEILKRMKVDWVVVDKQRDMRYGARAKLFKDRFVWEDKDYAVIKVL